MISDAVVHPMTGRPMWLEMRRQDATASDIAAVCGVHPTRTALQVWYDKTVGKLDVDNAMMKRGRWLEDGVINAVRDEYPEMAVGCTPDATVRVPGGRTVLQCKVVARSIFEDWEFGQPPIEYQLQVLTETMLAAPGATHGILAALVISEFTAELHLFDISVVPEAWASVVTKVGQWWADVTAGRKPRADYGKDGEVIGKLYRSLGDTAPVDLSADNRMAELCASYKALGEEIGGLEGDRKGVKAEIVEKLEGIARATCGQYKISNSLVSVSEKIVAAYDYDRLTISIPKTKG